MEAQAVRSAYLSFMEKRGYKVIKPASLVPQDDPTTLFTGAGMQPLLPYLLGQAHPEGIRITDSQPCLRSQDIEEVGDNRHTTFFEMLGNWNLGHASKTEQITAFFEFLTDAIGLEPEKLYISCFIGDIKNSIPKDTESASIWQKLFAAKGIQADIVEIGSQENGDKRGIKPGERIFYYDSNENWWSRGGNLEGTPLGDPCGPDSEVFYDFGEQYHDASYGLPHPASDGGRFIEIGNQVFMEYKREQNGSFSRLENPNVDFGGGLERITAATLGSPDVFEISLLKPIVVLLQGLSKVSYSQSPQAFKIIADHLRGAVFLTADGVKPSNKEQGYVLRRLVRRSLIKAHQLGLPADFIREVLEKIADLYEEAYPYLGELRDDILNTLIKENNSFQRTIKQGMKLIQKFADQNGEVLSGADVFKLSDTYGFSWELTLEEAQNLGVEVSSNWRSEFDELLKEQRERSRAKPKS